MGPLSSEIVTSTHCRGILAGYSDLVSAALAWNNHRLMGDITVHNAAARMSALPAVSEPRIHPLADGDQRSDAPRRSVTVLLADPIGAVSAALRPALVDHAGYRLLHARS